MSSLSPFRIINTIISTIPRHNRRRNRGYRSRASLKRFEKAVPRRDFLFKSKNEPVFSPTPPFFFDLPPETKTRLQRLCQLLSPAAAIILHSSSALRFTLNCYFLGKLPFRITILAGSATHTHERDGSPREHEREVSRHGHRGVSSPIDTRGGPARAQEKAQPAGLAGGRRCRRPRRRAS